MIQITEVKQALQRCNDAIFQELGDRYFYYKYRPNDIESRGSMVNKQKTRKGTPDTLLTDRKDRKIFIEYTTQDRSQNPKKFYEKIEEDIHSCFNFRKTQVQPQEVYKIIACHTSRLPEKEVRSLRALCQSYNSSCKFEQIGIDKLANELFDYPQLLNECLGISYGTGQIQQPIDFVDDYQKPALRLATPLDNSFLGREKELEKGLQLLKNNEIMVIRGEAGVGKTKFALELSRRFCDQSTKRRFLCIQNKGDLLTEDLERFLHKDKEYLLLVDDANRLSVLSSLLDYCMIRLSGKVKIILTVRDYAYPKVKSQITKYNGVTAISIERFTDDEIKEIIQSPPFGIVNSSYQKRILAIAQGNCRIALMCARIALEHNTLMSLADVSDLYEEYFGERYRNIRKSWGEEALKVLGLISFFQTITTRNEEVMQKIFTVFDMDGEHFWEVCRTLNENEIVDLFDEEYKIVKISDQVLSTYLFYQIFFQEKLLDYTILIANFLSSEHRFYDTLNPVITCYGFEKAEEKIKPMIGKAWEKEIKKKASKEVLDFLKIFHVFIPQQTLSYLSAYIKALPTIENPTFIFWEENKQSGVRQEPILDLLTSMRYQIDSVEIILALALKYIVKCPHVSLAWVSQIKEKWIFKHYSYRQNYELQHKVLDFFLASYSDPIEKIICKGILHAILPTFLANYHIDTESEGRKFVMYRVFLISGKPIYIFRKKIWDYLQMNFDRNLFLESIKKMYEWHEDESKKSCIQIAKFDLPYLKRLIRKIDLKNDFKACKQISHLIRSFEYLKIEGTASLRKKLTNHYYLLEKSFEISYESSSNRDELIRELIQSNCEGMRFRSYKKLFHDLEEICKMQEDYQSKSFLCSYILEDLLTKDTHLFYKVFKFFVENTHLNTMEVRLLNIYFDRSQEWRKMYKCIQSVNLVSAKNLWVLVFHNTVPQEWLPEKRFSMATEFYQVMEEVDFVPSYELAAIKKYENVISYPEGLTRYLTILLEKYNQGYKGGIMDEVILEMIDFCPIENRNAIKKLYFLNLDKQYIFDYKKKVFKKLLQSDPGFLIEYYDEAFMGYVSKRDLDNEALNLVLSLDNHEYIIENLILHLLNKNDYNLGRKLLPLFVNMDDEAEQRGLTFIHNQIRKYHNWSDYIEVIFQLVNDAFGEYKAECFFAFIEVNKDLEEFKKLPRYSSGFLSSGMSSIYNEKINFCNQLLDLINASPDKLSLIEHTIYINENIEQLKQAIKAEERSEFLRRQYE